MHVVPTVPLPLGKHISSARYHWIEIYHFPITIDSCYAMNMDAPKHMMISLMYFLMNNRILNPYSNSYSTSQFIIISHYGHTFNHMSYISTINSLIQLHILDYYAINKVLQLYT
jgi:hypothetical protein